MSSIFKTACSICALVVLVTASASAQGAERLSQVKKIYVESLGKGSGAPEMRQQLIRRLRRSRDLQVVADPKEADAVIRGTGRRWVTGRDSLSPHARNLRETSFGGFLSVEVIGKNGDTLWSYLVSPSGFAWNGIADDLARQLASKLLAAVKGGLPEPVAADPSHQVAGTLHGAGATFPAPLYQRWFELFQEQHPETHIAYEAVGSAEGVRRLEQGKIDFAASEMPVSDEAMAEGHQHFLHLPVVLGAVVVIYNVNGLHRTLNFSPETLAGIYLGKITKWNDPEIKRANAGVALPDADIVVLHRSDGSGTSFVWSDYLSKISPQWKASVGSNTTIAWPVGSGAEGNEGVAAAVQKTPNSIGYVEFIYAIQHELSFGAVRNSAGEFIKASLSSVTAAAAAAAEPSNSDFRVSITNPPGKDSYPIASYTWLLLPDAGNGAEKKALEDELIHWVLTTGQKKCAALGYAPLPAETAKRALNSFAP